MLEDAMDPMTIAIDTREQLPFEFSSGVAVVRSTLKTGDYSLVGMEDQVAFERKSLDDLVSSVIRDRKRFGAELARLAPMRHRAVVVEAGVGDVVNRRYRSEAHPNAVLAAANSIFLHYGVPVFFWGDRPHARFLLEDLLSRIWKGRAS